MPAENLSSGQAGWTRHAHDTDGAPRAGTPTGRAGLTRRRHALAWRAVAAGHQYRRQHDLGGSVGEVRPTASSWVVDRLQELQMRLIGNVLWLVLSGIELAIAYLLAGLLSIVFIITIPFAVPAFRLAGYTLWPFGRVVVRRPDAGAGSTVGNILWFLVAGWWLALLHVLFGLVLAITIIGLPFTVAHFKLAGLALTPYGKDIVEARFAHQHDVVVAAPQALGSGVSPVAGSR